MNVEIYVYIFIIFGISLVLLYVSTLANKTTTSPHKTTIAPHKTTIAPHKTTIAPHKTTIAPHKTTIAPHKTTIAPHKTTIAPHKTTIAPHKTTIAPHKTTIAPHKTTIAPHKTTIAPHKTSSCPYVQQPPSDADLCAKYNNAQGQSGCTSNDKCKWLGGTTTDKNCCSNSDCTTVDPNSWCKDNKTCQGVVKPFCILSNCDDNTGTISPDKLFPTPSYLTKGETYKQPDNTNGLVNLIWHTNNMTGTSDSLTAFPWDPNNKCKKVKRLIVSLWPEWTSTNYNNVVAKYGGSVPMLMTSYSGGNIATNQIKTVADNWGKATNTSIEYWLLPSWGFIDKKTAGSQYTAGNLLLALDAMCAIFEDTLGVAPTGVLLEKEATYDNYFITSNHIFGAMYSKWSGEFCNKKCRYLNDCFGSAASEYAPTYPDFVTSGPNYASADTNISDLTSNGSTRFPNFSWEDVYEAGWQDSASGHMKVPILGCTSPEYPLGYKLKHDFELDPGMGGCKVLPSVSSQVNIWREAAAADPSNPNVNNMEWGVGADDAVYKSFMKNYPGKPTCSPSSAAKFCIEGGPRPAGTPCYAGNSTGYTRPAVGRYCIDASDYGKFYNKYLSKKDKEYLDNNPTETVFVASGPGGDIAIQYSGFGSGFGEAGPGKDVLTPMIDGIRGEYGEQWPCRYGNTLAIYG